MLAARYRAGDDYRIICTRREGSCVAIIAPHGGRIERGTSEIACAIAGSEHNLYLFEGCLAEGNYEQLHLTSTRFDEPDCLALLAECDIVIAIHGCNGEGESVLLGGLDAGLGAEIVRCLDGCGIAVHSTGHPFPGAHPRNVCNRGRRGRGVQLELTDALRNGPAQERLIAAVRTAIVQHFKTATAVRRADSAE